MLPYLLQVFHEWTALLSHSPKIAKNYNTRHEAYLSMSTLFRDVLHTIDPRASFSRKQLFGYPTVAQHFA